MNTELQSAYCCFNCDEFSPEAETREAAEDAAHDAGWILGRSTHPDGAQIACPDCKVLVDDHGPCSHRHIRLPRIPVNQIDFDTEVARLMKAITPPISP